MSTAIQILQVRFRDNEYDIESLTVKRANLAEELARVESSLESYKGEQFGLTESILKLQLGENAPYFKMPTPGPKQD